MGKSKRKTIMSSLRTNSWPTIVGSVDTSLELNGDNLLTEIKSKLMSGKPADRHLAADMVSSSMANVDTYTDKELIELVRILSPICADRVENCRNAAIDSLCFLSSLSDKVCDLMVGADVMTPLITLFNNFFGSDWFKTQKSGLMTQIYVNACRLLTNLCGTSDKAVKVFNNSNITQILINGLKAFEVNIEVSIASAQCLSVVVEENPIPVLSLPENVDLMKELLGKPIENSSDLHLSNLMAFIAINLSVGTDVSPLGPVFSLIDQTLSAVCLPQIRDFAELLRQFTENEKTMDSLKKDFFELKNLLLAKTVALELITNVITGADGDPEEDVMDCDEDMDNSDEEVVDDSKNCEDNHQRVGPELEKLVLDHSVGEKVGQHLGTVDEELRQTLLRNNLGIEVLNSIESIQLCALSCVHNLVEGIPEERLAIGAQIWSQIQELVFKDTNLISKPLLEESTNTMRAVISRNPALSLTGDQLEVLCSRCQSIDSLNVKINVINLMSILAQRSDDIQSIEKITVLLMAGLQTEPDLVVRAELFDALIDIHSEDNKTDSLLIKLDLINRLKPLAVLFRNEAKKSPESKRNAVVSTVSLNLMPFIKYKQKVTNKK